MAFWLPKPPGCAKEAKPEGCNGAGVNLVLGKLLRLWSSARSADIVANRPRQPCRYCMYRSSRHVKSVRSRLVLIGCVARKATVCFFIANN